MQGNLPGGNITTSKQAAPGSTEVREKYCEEGVHRKAAMRLAAADQRYTTSRRALVEAMAAARRPLTIPEILSAAGNVTVSSAYRNLTLLCEADVARRVSGTDDLGRFELAEDVSGQHHHHLICSSCGTMADVKATDQLEKAVADAARQVAAETGYVVRAHRVDLEGLCPACR
ncbi:MAG TPA: transcriptional repressor [Actinomycetota bacterium]|nr:transcriptional repressor [Actinomycetota bacterium]